MTINRQFWINLVVSIVSLLLVASAFQNDRGAWPFAKPSWLAIESPTDPFTPTDPVRFLVSGDSGGAQVWVVGVNSSQQWFPIGVARKTSEGRWAADISRQAITAGTKLCVIRADDAANYDFSNYLTSGRSDPTVFQKGIPSPMGAMEDDCVSVM